MSWSYSGDPSTSELDRNRFMIGDTNEADPLFTDEELQFLIDTYGSNHNRLMYEIYSRLVIKYAKLGMKRTLGPQSEDTTARLNLFKALLDEYKKKLAAGSGLSLSKSSYPTIFYKGMQSNPPWPNPDYKKRRWPYV